MAHAEDPSSQESRIYMIIYYRNWILKGRCDGFRYLSFINSSLKASVGEDPVASDRTDRG